VSEKDGYSVHYWALLQHASGLVCHCTTPTRVSSNPHNVWVCHTGSTSLYLAPTATLLHAPRTASSPSICQHAPQPDSHALPTLKDLLSHPSAYCKGPTAQLAQLHAQRVVMMQFPRNCSENGFEGPEHDAIKLAPRPCR
jgi:hypothetical protein